ncbi:MAG: ABC transporter permease subunit [bacterium]
MIIKELRMLVRSYLYHATNILYIILISCLVFGMIWIYSTNKKTKPQYAEKVISTFFIILNLFVSMICPAYAINKISLEREKLTINLLRTTQLKYYHIFFGKLFSGILHILTLLFASLPIIILILPETNISTKVSLCYLVVFISSLMFITISLLFSSILKTRMSAVFTYIVIGIFNFCTLIMPLIVTKIFNLNISNKLLIALKTLNPFYVIFNVINDRLILKDFINIPIWAVISINYFLISIVIILVFFMIARLFQKDIIL